jgi:redox-sensitive bicupin YhaK (pirin superfamily)
VVLGQVEGVTSPINTRASINYLHVKLADGEQWRYVPPTGHDVAWAAVGRGALLTANTTIGREVAIFEQGNVPIDFTAQGDTEFVLGSALQHPHDLVSGYYSVHTNAAALEKGENEIKRIGAQLRSANLL